MALSLVRSPLYIFNSSTNGVYAILTLRVNNVVIYEIKKNKSVTSNGILFEVSELLRDYLDVNYNSVTTHSKSFNFTLTWYDANDTFVTASGGSGFISDGYGYFEDGYNSISSKGLLQSNNVVYRLQDSDVKIPIDRNEVTQVVYLSNNNIVKSQSITTGTLSAIQYIGSSRNSFKDRVKEDGGIIEDNVCLLRFDDSVDLDGVDTIRVISSDGIEEIKVKTISECRYTPIKVSFVNRYGAIQEIWFFKKSIESMNSTTEKYKSNIVNIFGAYDTTDHQVRNFNVQSNFKLTLNTGYVDESYNEPMKELLQSEKVWVEIDSVVKPVNLSTRNLTFKTSVNDKLVDYKIDVEYAFDGIQNVR
jgi:hypothetical protein